jgi:hypothetical protein
MSTALDFRLRKRNETFQTKVEQVCDVSSGDAPPSATPVRAPNQMKITVSDALFVTTKSSFTECLIFRGVFDEDLATLRHSRHCIFPNGLRSAHSALLH